VSSLLLRGFALPDRPLLLFTPEPWTRDVLALERARGLNIVHAVALAPPSLRARDWSGVRRLVFDESDGFWLTPEEPGGPEHLFREYVPTTWPGARLPHVWLEGHVAMQDRVIANLEAFFAGKPLPYAVRGS